MGWKSETGMWKSETGMGWKSETGTLEWDGRVRLGHWNGMEE